MDQAAFDLVRGRINQYRQFIQEELAKLEEQYQLLCLPTGSLKAMAVAAKARQVKQQIDECKGAVLCLGYLEQDLELMFAQPTEDIKS